MLPLGLSRISPPLATCQTCTTDGARRPHAQIAARIACAHRTGQIEQRFRRDLQLTLPF